jgi:hypothetical protein
MAYLGLGSKVQLECGSLPKTIISLVSLYETRTGATQWVGEFEPGIWERRIARAIAALFPIFHDNRRALSLFSSIPLSK